MCLFRWRSLQPLLGNTNGHRDTWLPLRPRNTPSSFRIQHDRLALRPFTAWRITTVFAKTKCYILVSIAFCIQRGSKGQENAYPQNKLDISLKSQAHNAISRFGSSRKPSPHTRHREHIYHHCSRHTKQQPVTTRSYELNCAEKFAKSSIYIVPLCLLEAWAPTPSHLTQNLTGVHPEANCELYVTASQEAICMERSELFPLF